MCCNLKTLNVQLMHSHLHSTRYDCCSQVVPTACKVDQWGAEIGTPSTKMMKKYGVTAGNPLSCLQHTLQMLVSNDILIAKYEVGVLIFCIQNIVTDQCLQCMFQATQRIDTHHTIFVHQLCERWASPFPEGQQLLSSWCCPDLSLVVSIF